MSKPKLRRFYSRANPGQIVLAETLGALHGGDPSYARSFPAWAARALAEGTLAEPCPCCSQPSDMICESNPSVIVPEEKFFQYYREMDSTLQ